jgi:hypothetical protein
MNKEQQELLDKAYENYLNKAKNYTTEDLFYNKLSGVGDIIEGMLSAYTRDFIPYSKEEFINKCKTDTEFSEKWGLKIEERELSLEERLEIADKFNTLIREDCLTKTHHPDETEEFKLIYRHAWLDSLGPNVVPERKLITITYNDKTIESYE